LQRGCSQLHLKNSAVSCKPQTHPASHQKVAESKVLVSNPRSAHCCTRASSSKTHQPTCVSSQAWATGSTSRKKTPSSHKWWRNHNANTTSLWRDPTARLRHAASTPPTSKLSATW